MSGIRPKQPYVVAFYEIDRAYGGPEEGGWWYNCGTLARVMCVTPSEGEAYRRAERANRLLDHLQRGKRSVNSVLYSGGRHSALVFIGTAPPHYPETRPHYE